MISEIKMNYYEILEINDIASEEVVKAAYKALVKKYHPDNGGKHKELKSMELINEAYEVLSDPIKRCEYDRTLVKGLVLCQDLAQNKMRSSTS